MTGDTPGRRRLRSLVHALPPAGQAASALFRSVPASSDHRRRRQRSSSRRLRRCGHRSSASNDLPEGGNSQADSLLLPGDLRVELGDLLLGVGEAALQSFDLDEPTLAFSFQDACEEVVADLDEPRPFGRVNDQDGASDTSVLMSTISSVCATAVAQGELAALKVAEKLVPFLRGDGSVFLDRPQSPAPGDERSMCLDGVRRRWRRIPSSFRCGRDQQYPPCCRTRAGVPHATA